MWVTEGKIAHDFGPLAEKYIYEIYLFRLHPQDPKTISQKHIMFLQTGTRSFKSTMIQVSFFLKPKSTTIFTPFSTHLHKKCNKHHHFKNKLIYNSRVQTGSRGRLRHPI